MGEKGVILLVDDSDLVANILIEYLKEAGFDLHRASNGIEGIEMTYRIIPDIIIMDVEMPLMQGYLASRLLKSRRGVKEIPIIMHTSLSEDRDEYWAFSSGADAFITKDFDNLNPLLERIRELIDHPPLNREQITEDAAGISRDNIFEIMSLHIDQQLFQTTLLNELSEVSRCIGSLELSLESIFSLISKVCQHNVAVIILNSNRKVLVFARPSRDIYAADLEDFLRICLSDFYQNFPEASGKKLEKTIFGITNRDDFQKIRSDMGKISSYACVPLEGSCTSTIGTLHCGNLINNYFSDLILNHMKVFSRGAGTIIENAMLMKQITEMEQSIRGVFSKFVPPEIIDDLVGRSQSSTLLAGEKRNVAVLFSDIRFFTQISENNRAEDVVQFLNQYFNTMGTIIQKHGGTIDKFIGDAILAVFGAPKSYEDNADRAARAALEMLQALDQVPCDNLRLPDSGLDIGIGIHQGEVIVGNIGSKDKFDYTVIGDTVNLASRLESLTKFYRAHIIVSEEVKNSLSDHVIPREIDRVRVKGKEQATTIFLLIFDKKSIFTDDILRNYNKALSMYKIKNWETAMEYFLKVQLSLPEDHITKIYIDRCREKIKNRPPEEWDGTWDPDFK